MARFAAQVRQEALAERIRWVLWQPFLLAIGIAAYFALATEPEPWLAAGMAGFALIAGIGAGYSRSAALRVLLAGVAALSLGFAAAKLRTELVRAPVLSARMGPLTLTGRVVTSEPRGYGSRLVLAPDPIDGLTATPLRIRLTIRAHSPVPKPGAHVALTAILMPPPEPSLPGDYDFARWAYFHQLGAVGYAYGVPHSLEPLRPPTRAEQAQASLEALRGAMTARVRAVVPGNNGAIAAALITGERVDIDEGDQTAFRDSGLMHVLSISGLHLALAGGFFFWTIRAAFAFFPAIALRDPIKKWAAIGALLGSTFYLLISGCEPPAVRSWIMLAVMFAAILVDRPALSLRSIALAAAAILLVTPENLLDPGCQMSFAAVTALISYAEWESTHRWSEAPHGWFHRGWRYFWGISVTSILAGLATAPIAIFHFDRASPFGILANLVALPVVGAVIMPAATAAMVLMPLGLDRLALIVMGKGVAVMMAIAHGVAGLPGAGAVVPSWPGGAVIAVMTGGLWIALWRRRWRWLGLMPIALGLVWALAVIPPDIVVARDSRTAAVTMSDGRLAFVGPPQDRYAAANWLRRTGDERSAADAIGGPGLRCDSLGCIARLQGQTVAFDRRAEALSEDCARAAVVIASVPAHASCSAAIVIDRDDLLAQGAHTLRFDGAWHIETVAEKRGIRPWTQCGLSSGGSDRPACLGPGRDRHHRDGFHRPG